MFANMSLKGKFITLEALSFAMFVAMAIFSLVELKGAVEDEKVNIQRLEMDIAVTENVSTMDIAFLKEVKLAKDVWLRGADREKLKKYRADFLVVESAFRRQPERSRPDIEKTGRRA